MLGEGACGTDVVPGFLGGPPPTPPAATMGCSFHVCLFLSCSSAWRPFLPTRSPGSHLRSSWLLCPDSVRHIFPS